MTKNIKEANVNTCDVSSFIVPEKIKEFCCGLKKIDDFFHNESMEYNEKNLAKTTMFYDQNTTDIIGFYTVMPAVLKLDFHGKADDVIAPLGDEGMEEFPAISIDYFAVDKEYQNQDVGKAMMYHLFGDLIKANVFLGIGFTGVIIKAIPNATDFYENVGFTYIKEWDENSYMNTYDMFFSFTKMISIPSIYDNLVDDI